MSITEFEAARGLTFFDRNVIDAAIAIAATGGDYPTSAIESLRYDRLFLASPWPEIYVNDHDRRHSLEISLLDFEHVRQAYVDAEYVPVMLPRDTVVDRADFILRKLEARWSLVQQRHPESVSSFPTLTYR